MEFSLKNSSIHTEFDKSYSKTEIYAVNKNYEIFNICRRIIVDANMAERYKFRKNDLIIDAQASRKIVIRQIR